MHKNLLFLLSILPVFCFSQVKEVIIPPSKDTARIRFTTTTVTTTEYKVDYLSTAPGNKPPIASAGQDVAVTLPVNTVTLSAISSSDADGSIISYKWEKISGGAAILNQANTALNVSGLIHGIYVFRVTVTDNGGLSDDDEVQVTVNPSSNIIRQNVIFEAGFDGTKPFFTENELYPQRCCSYSITQSRTIVRVGDGSFRSEVRSTDPQVSGGYRAEFIPPLNTRLIDGWYGYSVYMENWAACSTCGEHIMQWHPDNSDGSAVLAIWTKDATFNIKLNPSGGTSASGATSIKDGMKIVSNKWYDIVWHVVWSSDKTKGRIEMWIDGLKYVDFTGVTLTMRSVPYFKVGGINRWNMSNVNRVMYTDALRIGNASATYKDIAP